MNKWILYIAVLLLPAALQAQQLSLHDAVEIALRNNMGIQLARNNASAAGINNSYGVAGGLPQVSATGSDVEQVTSIK